MGKSCFNRPYAQAYAYDRDTARKRREWFLDSYERERQLQEVFDEQMVGYGMTGDPRINKHMPFEQEMTRVAEVDSHDPTWWVLDYPDTPEDNLLANIRGLGNDYQTRMALRRGFTRRPDESDEEWAARCESLLPSLDYRPYREGNWLRAKEAMQSHRDVHVQDEGPTGT